MICMRIVLGIIGFLLLIPGVCGVVFYGLGWADLIQRASWNFREFDVFWIFAVPSINIGILGFWLLAKSVAADWMVKASPAVAWIALGLNLAVILLMVVQPQDYPERLGETMTLSAIFIGTWLPGGLALLQLRKRT
jgi:hypothetical protein